VSVTFGAPVWVGNESRWRPSRRGRAVSRTQPRLGARPDRPGRRAAVHVRTTLDLDDQLVAALLERHPGRSKTEAIERAIADHLARDVAHDLLALRGKVDIEDTWRDLRAVDRHT